MNDSFLEDSFVEDSFRADENPTNPIKFGETRQTANKGIIRRTTEKVIESPALPIAGGVAGGLLGSGVASIPLAGVGGAGGEAIRQLAARSLGLDAPKTSLEALKDIGIEGAAQAIGEGAGSFVVSPALKVARPFLKKGVESVAPYTIQPAKEMLSDIFQLITKIKPKYASTLFNNPKVIFPETMKVAKKVWKDAAKEAGIPIDVTSPEIITALKSGAKDTVFGTFNKMVSGEPVTAAEAQTAKQALDLALMPAAKTERNKPLVALYGKMRDSFVDRIGEESPKLAAANKQYAIAKSGEKFRSFFPRNLNDTPAYFRSSVLPTVLFGSGAYRGEPGEGAAKALAAMGLTSPISIGLLIAAAGGGRNLGRAISPYAKKTLAASLAQMAGQKFK